MEQLITHIDSTIDGLNFIDAHRQLVNFYEFAFSIDAVLTNSLAASLHQLCRSFFRLLLIKIYEFQLRPSPLATSSEQQQQERDFFEAEIIHASLMVKDHYCGLTNHLTNNKSMKKVDILCFMIALISKTILKTALDRMANLNIFAKTPSIKTRTHLDRKSDRNKCSSESRPAERQPHKKSHLEHPNNIEEQVYIVLIYQTLGTLVSPQSFLCLRKKYIKQTIFQRSDSHDYDTIIKSLAHIRDNLSQKNICLVKERHERDRARTKKTEYMNNFSQSQLRSFIRKTLKTTDVFNEDRKKLSMKSLRKSSEGDGMERSFYNLANKNPKTSVRINNPTNKYSIAANIKYEMCSNLQHKSSPKKKKLISTVSTSANFYHARINLSKIVHKSGRKTDKQNSRSHETSMKNFDDVSSHPKRNKFNPVSFKELESSQGAVEPKRIDTYKQLQKNVQNIMKKVKRIRHETTNDEMGVQKLKQIKRDRNHHGLQMRDFSNDNILAKQIMQIKAQGAVLSKVNSLRQEPRTGIKAELSEKWHKLYNIKVEPSLPTQTSELEKVNFFKKKLEGTNGLYQKCSDRLRSKQKAFNDECEGRKEVIGDEFKLLAMIGR